MTSISKRTATNEAHSVTAEPEGVFFIPPDDDDDDDHHHHQWPPKTESVDKIDDLNRPLPRNTVFAYGVGHMLNDLTAASWFTYLLIFLTDVGLSPNEAAFVMLSGQLADGVATIFVGNLIDNYGHYKLWHAGGSLLVAISFSSVFGGCWVCAIFGTYSRLATTIAYSVFAAIFNVGWAATQVSHMALVNCISSNATVRVGLTSCRNAFTMVANLCLYGIAYFVFGAFPSKGPDDVEKQYRLIARASVLLGWSSILVFYAGVKEPKLEHLLGPADCPRVSCLSWFKKVLYYQVAFVYMITRLTTNVSQAFLAFYLIDDLDMRDSAKAVVPAAIYVCSFFVSIALQELGGWTGQRIKYFFTLGASLWILSGMFIFFLSSSSQNLVYLLAAVIGIANALMTVTAVSMEGILVGLDISGCAFVYASLSFLDKFACGIALFAIEALNTNDGRCRPEALGRRPCNTSTVRMTLALIPGGCALLGVCATLAMDLRTTLHATDLQKPLLSLEDLNEPGYSWKDNKCPTYVWTDQFPHVKTYDNSLSVWNKIASRTFRRWVSGRRDTSGMLH